MYIYYSNNNDNDDDDDDVNQAWKCCVVSRTFRPISPILIFDSGSYT